MVRCANELGYDGCVDTIRTNRRWSELDMTPCAAGRDAAHTLEPEQVQQITL